MFSIKKKAERRPNQYLYGEHYFAEWNERGLPEAWSFYRLDPSFEQLEFYTDSEAAARNILFALDKQYPAPAQK